MYRVCVLLLLLLVSVSPAEGADPNSESRLTIAFVLPLSGEWAFLGNGIRDAALLAQEDLKRKQFPVELVFEDGRGDLAISATAARRLLSHGKTDALISIISGVGKLLKPMAEKARVINIGICCDTEVADGQYSFINYLTAEQGVTRYIEHFSTEVGHGKSVGLYVMNESGFEKIVRELQLRVPDSMKITFVEHFDKGTTDFRPVLLRHRKINPDAFLVLGLSPEIELIARQARSIGISTPLTSIEGFGLSSDKEVFEGSWFIDSAALNTEFHRRFYERYGREVTPGVGHSYDSVLLLAAAFGFERADSRVEASAAHQYFRQISGVEGVTGKLSVRPDGVIWSDASVKKIDNERAVLAAR